MTTYRKAKEEHPLTGLGAALDQLSWRRLQDYHLELAEELEEAVGNGVTPVEVRRFVMARTRNYELALRCEQAARWLGVE